MSVFLTIATFLCRWAGVIIIDVSRVLVEQNFPLGELFAKQMIYNVVVDSCLFLIVKGLEIHFLHFKGMNKIHYPERMSWNRRMACDKVGLTLFSIALTLFSHSPSFWFGLEDKRDLFLADEHEQQRVKENDFYMNVMSSVMIVVFFPLIVCSIVMCVSPLLQRASPRYAKRIGELILWSPLIAIQFGVGIFTAVSQTVGTTWCYFDNHVQGFCVELMSNARFMPNNMIGGFIIVSLVIMIILVVMICIIFAIGISGVLLHVTAFEMMVGTEAGRVESPPLEQKPLNKAFVDRGPGSSIMD